MGHAAYVRGSNLISRQMCAVRGCHGCMYCTECKPTPRPADWGSKTRTKALKKAKGILSYCARFEKPTPSRADLADMVQADARFTRKTAEQASDEALRAVTP